MLVLDDGRCLPESNAILWHLAHGTDYFPTDPHQVSQVLRWMFFEQNIHESTIAVNRFLISYAKVADRHPEVIEFNHGRGHIALAAMEAHLQEHEFFVAGRYTSRDKTVLVPLTAAQVGDKLGTFHFSL